MKRLGPPKLGKKTPMLTAKQYIRMIKKEKKDLAQSQLAVRTLELLQTPRSSIIHPDTVVYRATTYGKHNKHQHKVTFFFPPRQVKRGKTGEQTLKGYSPRAPIIADCNCRDFAYRCEYYSAKRFGTSFIWRCNGQAPVAVDTDVGCKHIVASLRTIQRRWKAGKLPSKANKRSKKMSLVKG